MERNILWCQNLTDIDVSILLYDGLNKHSSDSVRLGFQKNSTLPSGTSPSTAIWCILCEILTLDITILWAVSPENGVHLCLWGWLVFIPVSKKECCDHPPKTLILHWLGLSCGSWSQFIPIIPMLPSGVSFSTVCLSWNSASPPAPGKGEDRMGHSYSVYRCSKVLHNAFFFFFCGGCAKCFISLYYSHCLNSLWGQTQLRHEPGPNLWLKSALRLLAAQSVLHSLPYFTCPVQLGSYSLQ